MCIRDRYSLTLTPYRYNTTNQNIKIPSNSTTAILILADGTVFWGKGIGAEKTTSGEICFNTSITGYQEILTDPSYANQIITFTFPHIGNVGTNFEDMESQAPVAHGLIVRSDITNPANFRSALSFEKWLKKFGLVGISGIDTRKLTEKIREHGSLNGVIQHSKSQKFNFSKMRDVLKRCPKMEGLDLAIKVSTKKPYSWKKGKWQLGENPKSCLLYTSDAADE